MRRIALRLLEKRKLVISIVIVVFGLYLLWYMWFTTGLISMDRIDYFDKQRWEYGVDGVMSNAHEFYIPGERSTCWLLIHGYGSTPNDMQETAIAINNEFSEFVRVPRLLGHGTVPSDVIQFDAYDWYEQVKTEYAVLNEVCDNVNLVGLSMGGTLALRLAQENDVHAVYVLSPFLNIRYKPWTIVKRERYIALIADVVKFTRKTDVGQINDPQGIMDHQGYLTFPLQPVKRSFPFIERTKQELSKITEPLLVQQSRYDDTIGISSLQLVYDSISSEQKQKVIFTRSNHVLMRDYDKEEVIQNIIDYEKTIRA